MERFLFILILSSCGHSKCPENIHCYSTFCLLFLLPQFSLTHNENLSSDSCPQSTRHFPAFPAGPYHLVVIATTPGKAGGFTPLNSPARAGNLPKERTQLRAPTTLQLCDLCDFLAALSGFLMPSSAQPVMHGMSSPPFCRGDDILQTKAQRGYTMCPRSDS